MDNKPKQEGGVTDKKDINAGSGAFNKGVEQDPNYNTGTKVSDEEKLTGHSPFPSSKPEPGEDDATKHQGEKER
jgi:hypothetical protein